MDDILTIYKLTHHEGGGFTRRLQGRVLIHENQVKLLEDHYGFLAELTENPQNALRRVLSLAHNPYFLVESHQDKQQEEDVQELPPTPQQQIEPETPSDWWYQLSMMKNPASLTAEKDKLYLDGTELSHEESAQVLDNVKNGKATLRYKKDLAKNINDFEVYFESLLKQEENSVDLSEALKHLDSISSKDPNTAEAAKLLRQHVYLDPMTGLGNRFAFEEFKEKNKPGVYLSIDGNGLKAINDAHGHEVGDETIKALGKAARDAANVVGKENVKLFRSGGDENLAYFEKPEHAHSFMREFSSRLDSIPLVGGTHKVSVSMGLGSDLKSADKALYEAKKQKFKSNGLKYTANGDLDSRNSELAHPVSETPHFFNSSLP